MPLRPTALFSWGRDGSLMMEDPDSRLPLLEPGGELLLGPCGVPRGTPAPLAVPVAPPPTRPRASHAEPEARAALVQHGGDGESSSEEHDFLPEADSSPPTPTSPGLSPQGPRIEPSHADSTWASGPRLDIRGGERPSVQAPSPRHPEAVRDSPQGSPPTRRRADGRLPALPHRVPSEEGSPLAAGVDEYWSEANAHGQDSTELEKPSERMAPRPSVSPWRYSQVNRYGQPVKPPGETPRTKHGWPSAKARSGPRLAEPSRRTIGQSASEATLRPRLGTRVACLELSSSPTRMLSPQRSASPPLPVTVLLGMPVSRCTSRSSGLFVGSPAGTPWSPAGSARGAARLRAWSLPAAGDAPRSPHRVGPRMTPAESALGGVVAARRQVKRLHAQVVELAAHCDALVTACAGSDGGRCDAEWGATMVPAHPALMRAAAEQLAKLRNRGHLKLAA